jgi:hypothetical protein
MAYICPRTPNNHPVGTKSAGFLHRLGQAHRLPPRTTPRKPPTVPQDAPKADLGALLRGWQAATPAERLDAHAAALGVQPWTLRALGAAVAGRYRNADGKWKSPVNTLAFPMRNAAREIVGIRLRAESGFKWAVDGSDNALFIPDMVPSDTCDTLGIAEGPTDTAALLGLSFQIIGRPNCSAYVQGTVDFCRQDRWHIVLFAQEDEAHVRPDKTYYWPGQEGAAVLAKALLPVARSVRVIFPLNTKDWRGFVQTGGTREIAACQISNSLEVRA